MPVRRLIAALLAAACMVAASPGYADIRQEMLTTKGGST